MNMAVRDTGGLETGRIELDVLRLALALLDQGHLVAFELRADGTYECVQVVGEPTEATKASLAEPRRRFPNDDFAAWVDAL